MDDNRQVFESLGSTGKPRVLWSQLGRKRSGTRWISNKRTECGRRAREQQPVRTLLLGVALVVGLAFSGGCGESLVSAPVDAPSTSSSKRAATPSGAACSTIRGTGSTPLIDDFEANPGKLPDNDGRGGWWFDYDDNSGGRLLREEVAAEAADGEGRSLHIVSSGFTKWGAGVATALRAATDENRSCSYDASAYSGVRLRARGRGRLRLTLGDAASTPAAQGGSCSRSGERCFDRPGVWLNLGPKWANFEYPFCTFFPEGWGGSSEGLDPSRLFAIHFRAGDRESVEAWVDDLAFYRTEAGPGDVSCRRPCPLQLVPPSARIEPSFSTAELSAELSVHTFEQQTRECGALMRRYLSFVPRRLGPRSTAPVLIMLHGSSANAESARTLMADNRFDALASRDGFIVVYGNAAPGSYTSPDPSFPNTGAWRHGFFDDGQVDDVDYLQRLLQDLTERGAIAGDNQVFLTGISNGGGMVLQAAKRLPHRFAGIAPVMPYDGEIPSPVPDLSSTELRRVLFAYTFNDPGMADGYHEILAPLPGQWAAAMGIPRAVVDAPRKTLLADAVVEGTGYPGKDAVALATRNSRVTQLDMVSPDGKSRVRVLRMDHAGHFWPNPRGDSSGWILRRWGFRNQDFDAADVIWEFLRPPS